MSTKHLYFLLFFIYFTNSYSQQIDVCDTCTVKSIREAVVQAKDHDVIFIRDGIYIENEILIDKPITITGSKKVIVDGKEKGYIFKVSADSVTIKNITLKINFWQIYKFDYLHEFIIYKGNFKKNLEQIKLSFKFKKWYNYN